RERRLIAVVAVDVSQAAREGGERRLVEAAVLGHARLRTVEQLRQHPARLRDADDGKGQSAALRHRLQRRKNLLLGEIPRGAEEHERIGTRSVVSFHVVKYLLNAARAAARNRAAPR